MSRYVSVRGWIEYPRHSIQEIIRIIQNFETKHKKYLLTVDQAKRYNSAWNFPDNVVGWTSCAFYGADLRDGDEKFILDQFQAISDSDDACKNDRDIYGYLFLYFEEPLREVIYRFGVE